MSPSAEDVPASAVISAEQLNRICQILYLRTGMIFNEQKRYYIERRIADRMRVLGLDSVVSYLGVIVSRPAETEALINAFTINETYFTGRKTSSRR